MKGPPGKPPSPNKIRACHHRTHRCGDDKMLTRRAEAGQLGTHARARGPTCQVLVFPSFSCTSPSIYLTGSTGRGKRHKSKIPCPNRIAISLPHGIRCLWSTFNFSLSRLCDGSGAGGTAHQRSRPDMNMHRFPMGNGSGAPPSCFSPLVASLACIGGRFGLVIKNSQPNAHALLRQPPPPHAAQQVSDLHPVVRHTGWKK